MDNVMLYGLLKKSVGGVAYAALIQSNASGNPAAFDDGATDVPLLSLDWSFGPPEQDYHGYDKPWAPGAGKNLYDLEWAFGDPSKSAVVTKDGEEIRIVTDGSKTYDGFITAAEHDLPAGTYYIKFRLKPGAVLGTGARLGLRKRGDHGFVSEATVLLDADTEEYTISGTTAENCYLSALGNYGSTGEDQAADFTVCDLIVSAEDVPFEPYANICPLVGRIDDTVLVSQSPDLSDAVEYPVSWEKTAGNVFFGSVTVGRFENLILKCDGEIESYDGEEIGEPWISDRDEYTEGGTPTPGAHVVYLDGDNAVSYPVSCSGVKSMNGQNYISTMASDGDVDAAYYCDTQLYIQKLIGGGDPE